MHKFLKSTNKKSTRSLTKSKKKSRQQKALKYDKKNNQKSCNKKMRLKQQLKHYEEIRQEYMIQKLANKLKIGLQNDDNTHIEPPKSKNNHFSESVQQIFNHQIIINKLDSTIQLSQKDIINVRQLSDAWDRLETIMNSICYISDSQSKTLQNHLNLISKLIKLSFISIIEKYAETVNYMAEDLDIINTQRNNDNKQIQIPNIDQIKIDNTKFQDMQKQIKQLKFKLEQSKYIESQLNKNIQLIQLKVSQQYKLIKLLQQWQYKQIIVAQETASRHQNKLIINELT